MKRTLVEMKNRYGDIIKGYSWPMSEPEKAQGNVVIVTGMQETALRYEEFASFLNKHGYNVYCLDHYGQGANVAEDQSDLGVWPVSGFRKFVNTVDDLVIKLRVTCRPTYLVAHSMGSFMVQDYIQRHTEHISKVVLIGSAHKPYAPMLGYLLAKLLIRKPQYKMIKNDEGKKEKVLKDPQKQSWYKKAPFFHNLALGNANKLVNAQHQAKIKAGLISKDSPKPNINAWLCTKEDVVQKYCLDPLCGGIQSGGFYREFFKGLSRLYRRRFLRKIRPSLSIFIIGGTEDPVGRYGKDLTRLYEMYRKIGIQDVELRLYEAMRHEVLNETDRETVYNDILNFIKE